MPQQYSRVFATLFSLTLLTGVSGTADVYAEYGVPSERRISWSAGLDPIGGIPNYAPVTCTGLDPTGTTDNSGQINLCIRNAASGTAVFIPAGIYRISGDINMKSNVVLRGAKATGAGPFLPNADATMTTLNMNGGNIIFNGGDKSTNWSPGPGRGTAITAGYVQGSTSITVSSATSYNVNDYISIYQDKDPAIIDDKNLDWLGEDGGGGDAHVMQQYTRVTAKNGNTLTIDPPIYYVTPNPTGQSIRRQTFNIVMAGLENIRINGNGTNIKLIQIEFARHCWVKGVETYNVGQDSSGSPHIWVQFSYGNEFRDGYHHKGVSNDSGRNYGLEFYNWNSRHKIENNIIRDTRHSIIFEGGGSGNVILYNYTDDNWESVQGSGASRDNSFLSEDAVPNHGAHPMMNLWEGNYASSIWGDYTQGSSSHNTLFRNRVSCRRSSYALSSSPWLWVCVEVETYNRYYNLVGNVIGMPTFTGGTLVSNSSANSPGPVIYRFGRNSAGGAYGDPTSYSTAIKHGNYDYVTDSVAHWDGGADHTLANSLYYLSKPAFFGTCAWPPFGPEGNPTAGTVPAKDRYDGTRLCAPPSSGPTTLAAPMHLRVQ